MIKPIKHYGDLICPCQKDKVIVYNTISFSAVYCRFCGKKIDWSDKHKLMQDHYCVVKGHQNG